MDLCSNCGEETDPDWVFCRACGAGIDMPDMIVPPVTPPTDGPAAPSVELISRNWDVVDIEASPPPDPLEEEPAGPPLPPGAVEVSVADIAVVETPPVEPGEIQAPPQPNESEAVDADDADRWDHLRPHGELPPLLVPSKVPGRVGQVLVLVFALSVLAATGIHFYLNTTIDGFGDGRVSPGRVEDAQLAADISLVVAAGCAVIALGGLLWWLIGRDKRTSLKPGASGIVALLAAVAGGLLIGIALTMSQETVAEALTANSVMVIALGLLMVASLAVVRTLGRIEDRAAK